MLDWEGNIKEPRDRPRYLVDELPDDDVMAAALTTSPSEEQELDRAFANLSLETTKEEIPWRESNSSSTAANPILKEETLLHALEQRRALSGFMMSIGATNAYHASELFPDDESQDSGATSDNDTNTEASAEDMEYSSEEWQSLDLDDYFVSSASAHQAARGVTAEHLSKVWKVSIPDAQRTLEATTQRRTHQDTPTLSRNYGTGDRMLRYKRIDEYFFMDTLFAKKKDGKSTRGHTCCQLFVTDKGFVYVVPMKSKSEVIHAVKQFAKAIGAPEAIIADASKEQTKKNELKQFLNSIGTELRVLEEGTPWANLAELYIGILKEAVRKDMCESDSPMVFWDYCIERRARINNLTAKDNFKLHGTTPHQVTTGDQGDISNLCRYGWYEWCYYREDTATFPHGKQVLGRVLGPALGEGNEMCQRVLKSNGEVVPRRSVRPLQEAEVHSPSEKRKREIFTELIRKRWGDSMKSVQPAKPKRPEGEDPEDDEHSDNYFEPHEFEERRPVPDMDDAVDSAGRLLNQQPAYDTLINAEVLLQQGETHVPAKVVRRAVGIDGSQVGTYDDNPFKSSVLYEVEFPDGQLKEYSANIIAENILYQVDQDGYSRTLFNAIVDYEKDEEVAVSKQD